MDTIKIVGEAPEEYALFRRRREARLARIRKYINCIWIFCATLIFLFWCFNYVTRRIEARTMLGRAKNVELAMRLTAIECYGYGSTPYDAGEESGLDKEAERKIMHYAEAGGRIRVLGWDEKENVPTGFIYSEGRMLVFYSLGEDGQPAWQVCRIQDILSAG